MPCNHKFKSYLNLERVDFEPTTLIVGTFIPEWPGGNTGEWFYGRKNNKFWDILPRLYGAPSLINASAREWKDFCKSKQIAITDLISTIDDADTANPEHVKILTGFDDQAIAYNFDDFDFVNIVGILQKHPSIQNVYLTRGITEAFWRHLWNPVMHYCNVNNLRERKLLPLSGNVFYQDVAINEPRGSSVAIPDDHIFLKWKQEWHL